MWSELLAQHRMARQNHTPSPMAPDPIEVFVHQVFAADTNYQDLAPNRSPPDAIANRIEQHIRDTIMAQGSNQYSDQDTALQHVFMHIHSTTTESIRAGASALCRYIRTTPSAALMAPFAQLLLLYLHGHRHDMDFIRHADYGNAMEALETLLHYMLFHDQDTTLGPDDVTELLRCFSTIKPTSPSELCASSCASALTVMWDTTVVRTNMLENDHSLAEVTIQLQPWLQLIHRLSCTCRRLSQTLSPILRAHRDTQQDAFCLSSDMEDIWQPRPETTFDMLVRARMLTLGSYKSIQAMRDYFPADPSSGSDTNSEQH